MNIPIPESDWKLLCQLKPVALDRLCSRILKKASAIAGNETEDSAYDRYIKLYRYINNSDKSLGRSFDQWKRSSAFFILANWRSEHLITDEEFTQFSSLAQNAVKLILSSSR